MRGIRFNHNKEYAGVLANSWPENYNACTIRTDHFATEVFNELSKSKVKTAHLVVTHGILVQNFAHLAYSLTQTNHKDYVYINSCINYTGISSATIKGK